MTRALYPGTFDPITNGHVDLIHRASRLFDELVIAVAESKSKGALFDLEERTDLVRRSIARVKNVRVTNFNGLLADEFEKQKVDVVIRGLRAISDFEFEFQMALMNRKLEPTIETIFLTPREEFTYLSSRIVKEIARLGGKVEAFVPPSVERALRAKFSSSSSSS